MPSKLPKAFYNETEAARALGVSPQEFRYLLRQHLGSSEAETDNSPQTTYHASDVLLLKMFVSGRLPVPPPSATPVAPVAPPPESCSTSGEVVEMGEALLEPQGSAV
ncbi:MAG: hypothetical protein IT162_04380 [Bryobacterales bacterium]|nr:hypothetical protein [Bryobacterales bacterium]